MSRSYLKHGLSALKTRQKRRRNGPIDRRTKTGQNAPTVIAEIATDLGGMDSMSAQAKIATESIGRNIAFLDEIDGLGFELLTLFRKLIKAEAKKIEANNSLLDEAGRLKKAIGKCSQQLAMIQRIYSYRVPVLNSLNRDLALIGLEKAPPKQKSLDEIIAEETEGNGQDKESEP